MSVKDLTPRKGKRLIDQSCHPNWLDSQIMVLNVFKCLCYPESTRTVFVKVPKDLKPFVCVLGGGVANLAFLEQDIASEVLEAIEGETFCLEHF